MPSPATSLGNIVSTMVSFAYCSLLAHQLQASLGALPDTSLT